MPTSSAIVIREARTEDAPAIAACLAAAFACFRSQYTAGAFADTVTDESAVRARMAHMTIFVAVTQAGTVTGTIAASAAGEAGYLRGFGVLEECQGSDLAAQLLAFAERHLLAAGCTHVALHVTTVLHRAIRFYEKNGFTRTGRTEDFFGMPLVEFTKPLTLK